MASHLKRVSIQQLGEKETIKIRAPKSNKKVPVPKYQVYPGHLYKGKVRVNKTSIGLEYTAPTGMEQRAYIKWKERHWAFLSDLKEMTKKEWLKFIKYEEA